MSYSGLDPEEYRRELLVAGADPEDANAAAAELARRQGGAR